MKAEVRPCLGRGGIRRFSTLDPTPTKAWTYLSLHCQSTGLLPREPPLGATTICTHSNLLHLCQPCLWTTNQYVCALRSEERTHTHRMCVQSRATPIRDGTGTCRGWGLTTTDSSDVSSLAWVLTDVDTVSSEGASVCLSSQESGTSEYLSPMNSLLPASKVEPSGIFEL